MPELRKKSKYLKKLKANNDEKFIALIVSRPKNENIVMMSEAQYNEMMKAKKNAEYLAMLDKSMAEAEAGGFVVKTIDELGDYEDSCSM